MRPHPCLFLFFRVGKQPLRSAPIPVIFLTTNLPSSFSYQHEATTLLPNSDFLSLPDHVTQWLLSNAPRIYDRRDLELPGNRQMALPSILTRYFCSELTIHQFTALLHARHAEDEKELDAAATECRKMKRPKHQPFARLPHPEASSTITSAPLAPAPLGTRNTPPPSPRIPDTGRSRSPPQVVFVLSV